MVEVIVLRPETAKLMQEDVERWKRDRRKRKDRIEAVLEGLPRDEAKSLLEAVMYYGRWRR